MHIGIEATPLRSFRSGGIWRYTDCLIRALCRMEAAHRYSLLFFNSFKPWARVALPTPPLARTVVREITHLPNFFFALYSAMGLRPRGLFGVESFLGPVDVFHSVNAIALPQRKGRRVLTIHDLTCFYFPQHHPWLRVKLFKMGVRRSAQMAHAIIVPSSSTKKDVLNLLGVPEEKVRVIHEAPAEPFRELPQEKVKPVLERYHLPYKGYILFAGNVEPRKNLVALIRAYDRLRESVRFEPVLVLAGGEGWRNRAIRQAIAASPFSSDIRVLGYLPDADLPAVMNGAALFVYPSIYEGFGLPPLEAMACGAPVIASKTSSLPEVLDDAAILIDPHSVEELFHAMRTVLLDDDLRLRMREQSLERARLFSWEKAAKETLAVYQEACR